MSDIEKRAASSEERKAAGPALQSGSQRSVAIGRTPAQRRWRAVGITFGTLFCLLSLAAGTVFGHFYWGVGKPLQDVIKRHGLEMGWNVIRHGDALYTWTPEQQFPDRTALNLLILGCDHDYDNYGRIVKGAARSDSILLARFDFIHNTINALTIPRDTAVHIPGHSGVHKINAAHSFGGAPLSVDTIKSVFGVDSDAYVDVSLDAFMKIVDAIGGIDINVAKKLDYDDNWAHLHIHLKPGYQHMDGYKAMGFVRMRHSDSDEMRSKRQHEFIEAMRTKIQSPGTFMVLPEVVKKLNDSLERSPGLTQDQLFTLANFARKLPKESVTIKTLPSFEGPSYVTIYPDKSAELIQEMFFPDQRVALNIDAPDPNVVRAVNAPYERGARRHARRSHGRARRSGADSGILSTPELSFPDSRPAAPDAGTLDPKPDAIPSDGGAKRDDSAPVEKPDRSDKPDKSDAGTSSKVPG